MGSTTRTRTRTRTVKVARRCCRCCIVRLPAAQQRLQQEAFCMLLHRVSLPHGPEKAPLARRTVICHHCVSCPVRTQQLALHPLHSVVIRWTHAALGHACRAWHSDGHAYGVWHSVWRRNDHAHSDGHACADAHRGVRAATRQGTHTPATITLRPCRGRFGRQPWVRCTDH